MTSKEFQVALQAPTKVSVEQALGAGGVGFISRMGAAACESEDDVVHVVSAICAAIFLLYLPVRLRELRTSSIKNVEGWRGLLKAAIGTLLSITLLAYLVTLMTASPSVLQLEMTLVASLAVSLVAALALTLLLWLEQKRTLKPSDLATLYLVASTLCDVVLLTIPCEATIHAGTSHPVLARFLLHLTLLIFECFGTQPTSTVLDPAQPPEELNGVLGRVFFNWMNPILLHGYKNTLVIQDLPPLSRDVKPKIIRTTVLQAWDQRVKPETKRTLPRALLECIKQPLIAPVMPRLFLIVFRYSQPLLIKRSIKYVTTASTGTSSTYGYWLIVSAVAIYIGLAVSTAIYWYRLNTLKLVTRSALVGLIHDKTMNSYNITYDNGEAVALMSTDADGLDGIAEMFHETWAQVLEVMVGLALLAGEVGWIWPLPLLLIFLCSRVSRYVAKHLQSRQKAWNRATQSRVAATTSTLGSMKAVKMLGFQHHLATRIQEVRKEELSAASEVRWMMVYYNASANALGIFSPAITLALFAVIAAARGRNFETETAFTTIAILGMVTHPANMVMTIVPRAVAAFSGFDRIQSYLLRPHLHDHRGSLQGATTSSSLSGGPASGQLAKPGPVILIQDLMVGGEQPILEGVSLELAPGSLAIISGPVGSGKSTLLRAMLGEITPTRGHVKLSTKRIAYCAQTPWLPDGSIREVIHGPTDQVDSRWYREVVDACCLAHDLNSLPDGDETQVGSRGLNLSGGQRQRVALARALFSRCTIVLLDDSFSALDGETEAKVCDNLFGPTGLFRKLKSTVVLVSNSTNYFPTADHIVILGNHGVRDQGSWEDIKVKAATIAKFVSDSHHGSKKDTTLSPGLDKLHAQVRGRDEAEVDLSRKTGDLALYEYYFRFVGWINLLLVFGCTASYSLFITIPQYWLRLWTESSGNDAVFWYICGFLLLSLISWTSTNGIMWSTVIRLAPQSGMRLHQHLLNIVASAPLSFFSTTDIGSILNRFSQDMQLIDKQLPSALANMGTQIFKLFMQAILLFTAQKWLALSLPACIALVYVIQKVYLRTSRQLRFLELESRAAVFSSFLESVDGLETMRSFGWRREVVEENITRLEDSQRPEFLLLSLQRWLNIVLDLIAAAIATGVIAIAVALRDYISGGQVGLALNIMLVANTTLLRLVESWTTLEVSLGAVSRLRVLEKNTQSEISADEDLEPPSSWPSRGQIEFKSFTASYRTNSTALRDVSLRINAGQKIILCGRTGSGKTSLLLALLRMLEPHSGTIEVDGVDLGRVPRDLLRRRCFVTVAQDALLLPNETLRFNLDPDSSASDDAVVGALVATGLWPHFARGGAAGQGWAGAETVGGNPILYGEVSSFRELSVGQCQLFALCRAMVRAGVLRDAGALPVVLLDEVTSALDPATESTIHRVIDQEFTGMGHTVIIVAHKLSVLSEHARPGRDVVVWMRDGQLQEIVTDLVATTLENLGGNN